MKYNPFKSIPPPVRYYFFIAVENLIPLVGYFFFNWTYKGIFLFYAVELTAYELTILPRIGIYVFATREYSDVASPVKKFGIAIAWILYSLGFFYGNLAFFLIAGLSNDNSSDGLTSFIHGNAFFIIFIFADYIYWFVRDYVVGRKHRAVDPDSEIAEIGGFPLLILTTTILIFIFMSALSIADENILFVMMLVVISLKAGAQAAKRYRKSKKGRKAAKVKDYSKTNTLNTISDLLSSSKASTGDMKDIERIAIDVRHLPVEKERSDPRLLVIGALAFSLACAVWFGIFVYMAGFTGSLPGSLLPLILSAVLGYMGVSRLVEKEFIRITHEKVSYSERHLRGYTRWEKNLPGDFRGLLIDSFTHKTDEGKETKYCVLLFARDRKSITLFVSRFKSEAYNVLKEFADALDLPALEEKDGEIVERKPEQAADDDI